MRKANADDYKRINEYFEESGRVFSEDDDIMVFEDLKEAGMYAYMDSLYSLIELLAKLSTDYEEDNMLTVVLEETGNVWIDPDDGMIYVI